MAGRPRKDQTQSAAPKKAVDKPAKAQLKGGEVNAQNGPISAPLDPQEAYKQSLMQDPPAEKSLQEQAAELMAQKVAVLGGNSGQSEVESNSQSVVAAPSMIDDLEKTSENMPAILAKYEEKCNTPSDINELLPYLRAVAEHCDHITEMGVRTPTSTWALLAGNPKRLVSYDIVRDPKVSEVEALAPNFKFIQGSSLEVDIEETDFIFIDTFHSATQLKLELERHANKVRKFIGMHDTFTFARTSEPVYEGIPMHVRCGRGLLYAVEEFLHQNPNWKVSFQTDKNNGLTILRRIS